MKTTFVLVIALALGGCASAPQAAPRKQPAGYQQANAQCEYEARSAMPRQSTNDAVAELLIGPDPDLKRLYVLCMKAKGFTVQ